MRASRSLGLFVMLLGVAAAVVVRFGTRGDYPQDAGPPIAALADGHVIAALRLEALMGSLSIALRAPFVALAQAFGAGDESTYRIGAVVCLLPAALLGLLLAVSARRYGRPRSMPLLVGILAVASPPLVAAVRLGHPEEALGGALAVAAVVLASRDRPLAAAVSLGLALATKQWALVAIAPTLLAAPRPARARLTAVALAVAALWTLPAIAADSSGFVGANQQAATAPGAVVRTTVWFLLAKPLVLHLHHVPVGLPTDFTVYHIPVWVQRVSHPLIVLATLPLALLLARRGPDRVRSQALPLLALAFLLRCVLDPVDNAYYHLPLFLTLLAWEATRPRRLPVVTLLTAAALWLTFSRIDPVATPVATNAIYLSWTAALGTYLLIALGIAPSVEIVKRFARTLHPSAWLGQRRSDSKIA